MMSGGLSNVLFAVTVAAAEVLHRDCGQGSASWRYMVWLCVFEIVAGRGRRGLERG
jgi:hypothetical protein